MKASQPSRRIKVRYLEAGLKVLARDGYPGLKLAEVCAAVGATTGSFYYAFDNWAAYTSELIEYWRENIADRAIQEAQAITEPRDRLDHMIELARTLPHGSEAAIRVWAAHDPLVMKIQRSVDAQRCAVIAATYEELLGDRDEAERYARAAMYLFIGHESGTLPSTETMEWAFRALMDRALNDVRDEG